MPTMNRIVLHHSGGPGTPTALDREHYHCIVDAGGIAHDGKHPISANAAGRRLLAGQYAAHTLNLNGGAIGLSMSCMGNAQWSDPKGSTAYFPTELQVAGLIREAARLCRVYRIAIDRRTVLTHAEVQPTLGVIQRQKWDFDYDPCGALTSRDPLAIGDMLRDRISTQFAAAVDDGRPVSPPSAAPQPVLRQGATGDAVKLLQSALGLREDGIFGPKTAAAVLSFQKAHQMLADGIVGPVTWAAVIPSA